MTVAPSMPTAAFHMPPDGVEYADLGADFLDRQDRSKVVHRLLKRLQLMLGRASWQTNR